MYYIRKNPNKSIRIRPFLKKKIFLYFTLSTRTAIFRIKKKTILITINCRVFVFRTERIWFVPNCWRIHWNRTMVEQKEEIVISGIGGLFPECDDMEELSELLFSKSNGITIDSRRWTPGIRLNSTIVTQWLTAIVWFLIFFFVWFFFFPPTRLFGRDMRYRKVKKRQHVRRDVFRR